MDEPKKKIDILIAGVGGQGVVLAGDILAEVALAAGYDVKKSDTLGMAQRGGGVIAHIRLGEEVASPLIEKGEADYLMALEKLEAARWAPYLKLEAIAVINNQAIPPLTVNRGEEVYPSDEAIREALGITDYFFINGGAAAGELGNTKVLNVVMLGALSMFLPFPPDAWKKVIQERLPAGTVELNTAAFSRGRKELLKEMSNISDQMKTFEAEHADELGDECGCEE